MIAVFLVLRLRGVLGRRDGHQGDFPDIFKQALKKEEQEAKGENDHEQAWERLSSGFPGRSMVVFLSDFLEAEDTLSERLRFSLSARYECLCLQILDSDEGARFIGEFAIAFNPVIREPMLDILFDEKIAGSFHFTPGQAYEEANNGNQSQVHWDMVSIQRPEYGGGEIWFDGELIRKDGEFQPSDLTKLNSDYLLGNSSI